MPIDFGKSKRKPDEIIKNIMKREKVTAAKLAGSMNVSDQVLRKRLRGDSKFSIDDFIDILDHLDYKIILVKAEDIV